MKSMTLRLEDALHERLQAHAARTRRSMAQTVQLFLEEALDPRVTVEEALEARGVSAQPERMGSPSQSACSGATLHRKGSFCKSCGETP